MVLLELYAFVGDVVTYYLDNQARESRLVTAVQRKNVIALARMLGYRLHGARAATAEVIFSIARPAAADVRIPAGTVVRTREVTEPIRLHVPAKRYLCATDAEYQAQLSPASIQSLALQGGPFSADEVEAFERNSHFRAAVALRRWDDLAKIPNLDVPPLEHYRPRLERVLRDS